MLVRLLRCCCYHKGTYFQANHNALQIVSEVIIVVVATTKVRIFKQITTSSTWVTHLLRLLLLPQRYVFSSKSQLKRCEILFFLSCCCYHKGTYFQANHNTELVTYLIRQLLLLPQRYVFSSKSQRGVYRGKTRFCCCCYHKGTYFQANHNTERVCYTPLRVVVATTKVRIFKQITTASSVR